MLLRTAAASLEVDAPRLEAEILLAHLLGRPRAWLFAHSGDPLDAAIRERYDALVARRRAGEPIAYLTGTRDFHGLTLAVAPGVLIPRAETELLVELALAEIDTRSCSTALDLGTGSGAIALAVAAARPAVRVTAVERSVTAAAIAADNIARSGQSRVELVASDWFSALLGRRFDLIVSNPPYIAADDHHLGEGDLRFEPPEALASGGDGLDAIRAIVADAPRHLSAGAALMVEHGHEQGAEVRALFVSGGFGEVDSVRDLEGRERVTRGRWSP